MVLRQLCEGIMCAGCGTTFYLTFNIGDVSLTHPLKYWDNLKKFVGKENTGQICKIFYIQLTNMKHGTKNVRVGTVAAEVTVVTVLTLVQ